MNCPTCGSDHRAPLGRSRFRCLAPARLEAVPCEPPSLGSAWTTRPNNSVTDGTCGTIYVDTEVRAHHRLTQIILNGC